MIPDDRVLFHRRGLVFGLQDGIETHVEDVANGKACDCICEECSAPLVARNLGQVRRPHFAHAAGDKCENKVEPGFIRSGAQILQEQQELRHPVVHTHILESPRSVHIAPEKVEAVVVRGQQPEIQVWLKDRLLRLFVRPSNRISRMLRTQIGKDGHSAMLLVIRTDFEGVIYARDVRRALVNPAAQRLWLYNAKTEREAERRSFRRLLLEVPPRPMINRGPILPLAQSSGGTEFCWRCKCMREVDRRRMLLLPGLRSALPAIS